MIDWLRNHFPVGTNYLVCQHNQEQINSFFVEHLVAPFQVGRKHNLWGELAEQLPLIGRNLGWVPNKIPGIFLNDNVVLEIADALAVQEKYYQPCPDHFKTAKSLLNQLSIEYLVQRNPLFLSEGETKILWFLTQWVKKPEFLIVGYLPAGLSRQRTDAIVNFLMQIHSQHDFYPVIILGLLLDNTDWYKPLLNHDAWQTVHQWPEYKT